MMYVKFCFLFLSVFYVFLFVPRIKTIIHLHKYIVYSPSCQNLKAVSPFQRLKGQVTAIEFIRHETLNILYSLQRQCTHSSYSHLHNAPYHFNSLMVSVSNFVWKHGFIVCINCNLLYQCKILQKMGKSEVEADENISGGNLNRRTG